MLNEKMPYTLRESSRARYVQLQFSLREGLIVIVPKGFDRRHIDAILESKRAWVERAQRKIEEERRLLAARPAAPRPEQIVLPALGEEWTVEYKSTGSRKFIIEERLGGTLSIYGEVDNPVACQAALRYWLHRKARKRLVPWLEELARDKGFRFKQARVRSQKTRWGSCSSNGTISLNISLLFIPPALVRYVLIHELCHTVHLNHSPEFWALVARHEPAFKDARASLRAASRALPGWLASP